MSVQTWQPEDKIATDANHSSADLSKAKPGERSLAAWRLRLKTLQSAFPSPWRELGNDQSFENTFRLAVSLLDKMKHPRAFGNQKAWQGYLGDPALPDYSKCQDAEMAESSMPLADVIHEMVGLFNGMPNWNHPQTMANVIPPANTAAIVGATLTGIFSPNIVEGEYSWNVAKTELESAAMLARMIGWDPKTAGGLYTFGGTGCYLYGTKLALTTVLGPESRHSGIREDVQVLVSKEAHYAKYNCTDWTGLGMNNVRTVEVDEHNRMSMPHLREVMAACRREGKPVAMIVCTMGTTDAFAIDPIEEVRQIVDNYENAGGHPKPLIYADAVIGWSWLAFGSYDFKKNPLEFSAKVLPVLEENYRKIAPIRHADAIGTDFHKTGWAPYNCSMFMVRDYSKFTSLMERPMPAYLQDRTPYNAFKFSLETSRTGAYSMAGWATLRLFGNEGFQVMLGRIIEIQVFFRHLLEADRNLVCVNSDNYGFVTLFRVYPSHIDAQAQLELEVNDPSQREALRAYNLLQQRVANKLFAMLRDPSQKVAGWENPPYTSFTMGYRPPAYAPQEQDGRFWMYALKAFPMSPNSNELSMLVVRNYVLKARDLVIAEILEEHRIREQNGAAQAHHSSTGPRSTANWFGDNEEIPIAYLLPDASADSDARHQPRSGPMANLTNGTHLGVEDILTKIPVCSHLSERQIKQLIKVGSFQSVESERVLFQEGDPADKVYLVLQGRVQVFRQLASGQETVLAAFGHGSFFGEMALFESGLRSAAVRTLEPCKFFVFDGEQFLALALG